MTPPKTAQVETWQRPVLIVGAGRSGTNLLAMALDQASGLKNVYEQRYVWTKGAKDNRSDIRGSKDATPATTAYIRRRFQKLSGENRLVDKTPSNSLRIDFCREVFPHCQIIHVIRDPLDNIASRLHELSLLGVEVTETQDSETQQSHRSRGNILSDRAAHVRRLLTRRNIPIDRLPVAILDQLSETFRIAVMGRGSRWGERVPGTDQISQAFGIEAALSHQWLQCTAMVRLASAKLTTEQFLELRYEDMVLAPEQTGQRVAAFLGLNKDKSLLSYLSEHAKPETVNRHEDRLSRSQIDSIQRFLKSNSASSSWETAS